MPPKLERATADARMALRAGDLLRACDIALDAFPDAAPVGREGVDLAKLHVLAQARMGNTGQAAALYERYALSAADDLDAQALGARMLKDQAFAGAQVDFDALRDASRAYLAVYERFRDPYPGINAASLALIAGDNVAARKIAERLLTTERLQDPRGYYDTATVAEALLILGRLDDCASRIEEACRLADADIGSRSTTYKQLSLLGTAVSIPAQALEQLLSPLKPPDVFAYFAPPDWRPDDGDLHAGIDRLLGNRRIAVAYGSLSGGPEIMIAEHILEAGGELNVVLPFLEKDFVRHFVGMESRWYGRFRACMEKAATVTFAADSSYVGDSRQLRFGTAVAMGLARLRADQFASTAFRIGAWGDGASAEEIRRVASVADLPDYAAHALSEDAADSPAAASVAGREPERALKAIIFADYPSFSKLAEHVLPLFWEEIMRRISVVLKRHGDTVAYRNTWGDAIYAVVDTARNAAFIALEIVEALDDADYRLLGLDKAVGMRVGAHLGPVYAGEDPVTGNKTYFGTQVSRAARIEPITPPGAVYVTEQFASVLALEEPDLSCTYVGRLELPKGHGPQRMYRLSRPSPLTRSLKNPRSVGKNLRAAQPVPKG